MLLDMGEFVGEQLFAGLGLRLVLALVEVDVGFMGEGFRPQVFGDRCRLGVVVETDGGKVTTDHCFHLRP